MKMRIIITSISLVCLIIPSVLVTANNTTPGNKIIDINRWFFLDVYEDGNLVGDKKSVHLTIVSHNYDGGNKISVYWEGVDIYPVDYLKKMQLTPEHYSTDDGSIKDVVLTRDSFSFKIVVLPVFGQEGTIQVVGQTEGNLNVEATALLIVDDIKKFFNQAKVEPNSLVLHTKKCKLDWRQTDKIILPYNEVL